MKNADMAAMPQPLETNVHGMTVWNGHTGLTKREHYAGLAMQGGWYDMTDAGKEKHYEYAARACVAMADALLAALEEQ